MDPKSPKQEALGEEEVLSSRFVAHLFPFREGASFETLYEAAKASSPKADHYPYALLAGETRKSSDDGEPGGSAGRPMLALLEERGIDCALLVVARYFGGRKLGIPRLRRSFLSASEQAIAHAEYLVLRTYEAYRVRLSYSLYERWKSVALRRGYRILSPRYGEEVEAEILGDATMASAFAPFLRAGGALVPLGEKKQWEEIKE